MHKGAKWALVIAALMLTGCSSWTTHNNPAGFSIQIPKTWTVTKQGGLITVAGTDKERVTIYPFQVDGRLNAQMAQNLLVELSSALWPQQKWEMPKSGWEFGSNGVRAVGADESTLREMTALWWTNTDKGAVVFFYGVGARPEQYQKLQPTFANILKSFRVTPPGAAGGAGAEAGVEFAQWKDPNVGAFSCEVPKGWQTQGGLVYKGVVSLFDISSRSPDGQFIVRINDVKLPHMYSELSEVLATNGAREGDILSDGTKVQSYTPGVQFAENYVLETAGQNCSNLQLLSRRELPDYIQSLAQRGLLDNSAQHDAGEVIYTCENGGQTYVGYQFAKTSVRSYERLATLWNIDQLHGFLAPSGREAQADAILQRTLATIRWDQQWLAINRKMTQQMARDYQEYFNYVSQLQQQTTADRWASMDRINEQRGDVLLGQTRVVDPETGTAYKVQSGSTYYWIDPTHNVIAGTNIPYQPTWDFREMIETYK
ncbi:MAG TPA: hypothetical protein VF791_02140 [Pyrinomonadaceae bacterium]